MKKFKSLFRSTLLEIAFIFLFAVSFQLTAQETSFQAVAESSDMVLITGKSTLHDWEVKCPLVFDYPEEMSLDLQSGGEIESFNFKVDVATMDGGRGAAMNKKIFKAMKSDVYPHVAFTQLSGGSYGVLTPGQPATVNVVGKLSIAGVDKTVNIAGTVTMQNAQIVVEGSKAMKLSDFDIDPPSAMFGQIQTKDDIVVHFKFMYEKVNP